MNRTDSNVTQDADANTLVSAGVPVAIADVLIALLRANPTPSIDPFVDVAPPRAGEQRPPWPKDRREDQHLAAARRARNTSPSKTRHLVLPAPKVSPKVTSGPTIDLTTAPRKISGPGGSTNRPESPPVPDTLADCHDARDLWPYYKATADPYARERLILHYAPLVKFVAGRIGSGLPSNIDQGDLIADGMFGLFDAIEKFDPSRANKFETYAILRVKGAIYDRLRTLDWVPRSVRTKMKAVDRAHQALEARLQRNPTDQEVATESGLTIRELRGVYKQSSRTAVLSLDEHIGHTGNTSTLGDMLIHGEHVGPSDRIEDTELKNELRKAVLQLHEKDRIVITLYYFEGLTLSEIGRVLGVTESRACQLHGRAIASLRAHMSAHV